MAKKNKMTKAAGLPKAFLRKLTSITAKRPRIVINHILKHGFITTEELSELYGYDHAPRAARDVREQGIPLETYRVEGKNGRKIAAYCFGDPTKVQGGKFGGRKTWSKDLKNELISLHGERCIICFTPYEPRYLQIDHRIPYEVGGEPKGKSCKEHYMLLCGSCNRAKSWSCEHCMNWKDDHLTEVCRTCYWANPENYKHIALRLIRRLDVTWTEDEVSEYDKLAELSKHAELDLPDFVKHCLRRVSD
ncbi:MAG: hypothetical protein JW709_03780 [Sedimentisphaerales bacterium]|nr:hypothetical protein [Sedimentisphaerales bacterium]